MAPPHSNSTLKTSGLTSELGGELIEGYDALCDELAGVKFLVVGLKFCWEGDVDGDEAHVRVGHSYVLVNGRQ